MDFEYRYDVATLVGDALTRTIKLRISSFHLFFIIYKERNQSSRGGTPLVYNTTAGSYRLHHTSPFANTGYLLPYKGLPTSLII